MAGASEMTCFFVQRGVLLLHAVAKGHRVIRHILVWRRCNVKAYSFGDHFKVKRLKCEIIDLALQNPCGIGFWMFFGWF